MIDQILENHFLSAWAGLLPRAPGQIGRIHESDSELVPLGDGRLLALTVDTVAEEVALGLYRDPRTAGRMAATASLSDLAAVGAEPIGLLTSVTFPAASRDAAQRAIAEGLAEVCRAARTFVLGGDTNEGPALAVSCVAVGTVPAGPPMHRIGARPGDRIFVSGPMGLGSALAAAVFLELEDGLCEESFAPPLRLGEGQAIRGIASACIDTSDGFVAGLDQLARLNAAAFQVTLPIERLLHPDAQRARDRSGLPPLAFLSAPHGEYELLFTVPEQRVAAFAEAASRLGWRPLEIGRVAEGEGVEIDGRPIDGAGLRNLFAACGGEVRGYLKALCRLTA